MDLLQNINDRCSAIVATPNTSPYEISSTTEDWLDNPYYNGLIKMRPFGFSEFTGMIFATVVNLQVTPCFKGVPMLHYIIDYEGDLRIPQFTTNESWPFLFAGIKEWLFINKVECGRLHIYTAPHIKIKLDSKFAPLNQYNEQVTNQEIKDFINDVAPLQNK